MTSAAEMTSDPGTDAMTTKRRWRWTWIAFLASILAMGAHRALPADEGSAHGPRIVMIIRHAEKPEAGNGERSPDLSPRGYERAAALAKVIPEHFPRPDFLIATKRSKHSNRPVETITPLSKALHERIDATFRDEAFQEVARAVLTDPKYAGKVVLIAWHHGQIPNLARALGAKDVSAKWNSRVFDRVWEITYDHGNAAWHDLPENALPGDSR
jgi:phosphohistidine phosphatase SixA